MKQYVYISGFNVKENNRGTAALGYGAISFLLEKGYLKKGQTIIRIKQLSLLGFVKTILFKYPKWSQNEEVTIENSIWQYKTYYTNNFEKWMCACFPFLRKCFSLGKVINETECIAAINGGDGFSDIYGKAIFEKRLDGIRFAMKYRIPLIFLPQTIGPFTDKIVYKRAIVMLKYAQVVYVRDNCFTSELEKNCVRYEVTNDLSYYMKPEPWSVLIDTPNSVGINVNGLAYENGFSNLAGHFDTYPLLIKNIIERFQSIGKVVYLISHSYNYMTPEPFNDDLKAARDLYCLLEKKTNVVLVDKDLTAPQVKYLISQMSFFVGTRMHSNFAAIFSKVPLFGLSYSYKFKGAFERNGIFNRTANILDIQLSDIRLIVDEIEKAYNEDVVKFKNK